MRHEQQFREIFDGEAAIREDFPLQGKMERGSGDTAGSTRGGSEVPVESEIEREAAGDEEPRRGDRTSKTKPLKIKVGRRARAWVRGKRWKLSGGNEQGSVVVEGGEVGAV